MAELLLLRHAQSLWNAEGRWQGWADVDLSPAGIAAAEAAAPTLEALADSNPDRAFSSVYSSDLRRSQHTAEILAARLKLGPVYQEPALRERSVGHWTGLLTEELESQFPGELARYHDATKARDLNAAPPGGESIGTIHERVFPALSRIFETCQGRTPLVVSHGGIIRMVASALGDSVSPVKNLQGLWLSCDTDGTLRSKGLFRPLETPPEMPITSSSDQIL